MPNCKDGMGVSGKPMLLFMIAAEKFTIGVIAKYAATLYD